MRIQLLSAACRLAVCALLLTGAMSSNEAQTPTTTADRVTLCELYQHPEQYQGKVVQVYASISGPELALDDLAASTACPAQMKLKLEIPSEHAIDQMNVETRADIKVLRRGYHANQIAVIAGRFNAAFVRRDGVRTAIAGGDPQGYGRGRDFDGVLVLQSLTEFTVLQDSHR